MKYVDLVISNNSDKTDRLYTYGCGFDDVSVGRKVLAPFGKGDKLREAYVFGVRSELSEEIKGMKSVDSVDEHVSLTEEAVKTCGWMRRRYGIKYIDAVNCFLPSGPAPKRGKGRSPFDGAQGEGQDVHELTGEQAAALGKVSPFVTGRRHGVFLLHGVTGSGKTEVYLRLIEETLAQGRTAIMLVPEISLTPQTVAVFAGRFGSRVSVTHSRLTLGQRYEQWKKARDGQSDYSQGVAQVSGRHRLAHDGGHAPSLPAEPEERPRQRRHADDTAHGVRRLYQDGARHKSVS